MKILNIFRKKEGYIPLSEMQNKVDRKGAFLWKVRCWRTFQ